MSLSLCNSRSKKREKTSYIHYECRMKHCNSYFRVKFMNYRLCHFDGNWLHNHPMNARHIESMFTLLTREEKDEIIELRSKGASPYFVRKNLKLTISPNQLYNYSREALRPKFINEISNLKKESERWNKNYIVTFHQNKGEFHGITLINRSMLDKPYSYDICVMDDTMCTNKFVLIHIDRYLFILICLYLYQLVFIHNCFCFCLLE